MCWWTGERVQPSQHPSLQVFCLVDSHYDYFAHIGKRVVGNHRGFKYIRENIQNNKGCHRATCRGLAWNKVLTFKVSGIVQYLQHMAIEYLRQVVAISLWQVMVGVSRLV